MYEEGKTTNNAHIDDDPSEFKWGVDSAGR